MCASCGRFGILQLDGGSRRSSRDLFPLNALQRFEVELIKRVPLSCKAAINQNFHSDAFQRRQHKMLDWMIHLFFFFIFLSIKITDLAAFIFGI